MKREWQSIMSWVFRLYLWRGTAILVLGVGLLSGCTKPLFAPAPFHTATLPPPHETVKLPKPSLMPEYIAQTWPDSDAMLSLKQYQSYEYRTSDWPKVYEREWEVAPWPGICVWMDMTSILEEGDDYRTDIVGRASLIVDGKKLDPTSKVFGGTPALYAEILREGWTKPAIYSGWPYQLCWPVDLTQGIHEITFSFQRISGDQVSYTWFFGITGE